MAYDDYITKELPQDEFLGEDVTKKLLYYPLVTRETYKTMGRIPDMILSGKMCNDLGLPKFNPTTDRAMICGSPAMLKDLRTTLDGLGFKISEGIGQAGDYVIERAFVS